MKIIVEEIMENEDATCTVVLDLDEEATMKLIEAGFISILKEYTERESERKK